MRPVTERFLHALRGSHRMVADARALTQYQTGPSPTGTPLPILDQERTGGTVSEVIYDASAAVMGRGTLTTLGWPDGPDGLLAPYGNEVFLRRGIDYGDGTQELVPLGYYRIRSTEQEAVPDGAVTLELADRMAVIVDARMVHPRQFRAGTSVRDIFEALVHQVLPQAVLAFDWPAHLDRIQRGQVVEEDRYEFLRDLARSRGKIMSWDGHGVLQVRSLPDPAAPVWDVDAGPNGVLVALSRRLSREGVYNAVVARGEGTDDNPPVRALARDLSPSSPTYWHGPFGQVPRYYVSPFIETRPQARDAAHAILAAALGLPYEVSFEAIPNSALEVYDPVRMRAQIGESYETHVVDTVTVPLTAEVPVTGTTRQQLDPFIDTEDE